MKWINHLIVALIGLFSGIFLLNPTFGLLEIPDTLPVVGHLDEALAALILLNCLAYFGFDVTRLVRKAEDARKRRQKQRLDAEVEIVPPQPRKP
ncbi:MAG TPA: hypothetical protein VMN36_03680 [Verrucomicrobiales bacterium]|nr:hypothetical protein [Verrucomicrobiales bacterium]